MKPRYSERVSIESSVTFTIGAHAGEGRALDITVPGCLVESPVSVKVGDRMRLRLLLPDHQSPLLVSLAVVRWVRGLRFGVEFIGMEEKERLRLNRFVTQLLQRRAQIGSRGKEHFSESGMLNWHLDVYEHSHKS